MVLNDVLMIAAVLLSPFLAVFIQRKIDVLREKRGHRLWIFRTLMATRGNRISLEHVQALNSIELFFDHPKKDKMIVEKWNEYLDHFGQGPKEGEKDYSAKLNSWLGKGDDLLADLLQIMGGSLGYNFDKVKIKRGIYIPRGHGEELNDQFMIRKGLLDIVTGKAALNVRAMDEQGIDKK